MKCYKVIVYHEAALATSLALLRHLPHSCIFRLGDSGDTNVSLNFPVYLTTNWPLGPQTSPLQTLVAIRIERLGYKHAPQSF